MFCIFVQNIPIFFMHTVQVSLATTLAGHQNPIFALDYAVSSASLFTGGNDRGIVEWDMNNGTFKRVLCAVPASVYVLKFLPTTNILLAGLRNGEVWFIDVVKQELLRKLEVEKGAVFALCYLSEKNEVLGIGEEGVAYVWSLDSFELLYRFRVSPTTVRCVQFDAYNKELLFGDKEGSIYRYDVQEFKELQKQKIHTMPVTAICSTQNKLFTGGRDAQLYSLGKHDLAVQQNITPHLFTVYGILQHPSSSILTTVSRDKSIKFWDPQSLALLKYVSLDRGFECHHLSINAAIYMEGKNQLVTVSDDKLVKVWDVSVATT